MLKNYWKIAWRNLTRNRVYSIVNILGLALGMAIVLLIGAWIHGELTFNTGFPQHDRIMAVMQHSTHGGRKDTWRACPIPLAAELRDHYGSDFDDVVLSSFYDAHSLQTGNSDPISQGGICAQAGFPALLGLHMISGQSQLDGPASMLVSRSAARALFGNSDAAGRIVKIDNKASLKITGVYEDMPQNSDWKELDLVLSWEYFEGSSSFAKENEHEWNANSFQILAKLRPTADVTKVNERIKGALEGHERKDKPVVFLHPMDRWHLYSNFKDGKNTGGAIQYVWMFGSIGVFILLLACINFMNLSTARSEKRAKEVGIRKAVGSVRKQLIGQFFCESFLIAFLAFILSLLLVWVSLPWFNDVSNKQITILWSNPLFWTASIAFTFLTGIIAGCYPALYLSSFNPVSVLKGSFKAGRFASMPRKVLVVIQFTVSVILIIGTIFVFKQLQFAKNRPVGYSRAGLIDIEVTNDDLHKHFAALRSDLINTSTVVDIAESSSPTTGVYNNRGDITWKQKDPSMTSFFGNINVTSEYGKTVGWQFTDGRDFNSSIIADSSAIVLNQAAVKYMNLKNPVGEIVHVGKKDLTVIGVIKDMVMESPYEPVKQTIFRIGRGALDNVIIRVNPRISAHEALSKIAAVCKNYSPSVPFSYKFADDDYARKFASEERVGKLANSFALLAIFISCIGMFGMASYVAEQKVKEIGVRKVLGASVFGLWQLMSKEFVVLVIIALLIAMPVAYNFMNTWLQHYTYRTPLSWWVFAVTCFGSLAITLLTVSYQSIKAALANPVKSLRSE